MKSVSISEFRANLLKYLTSAQHGERINVTSKGEYLATLTPPMSQAKVATQKLQRLAKTAKLNDVISPVDSNWEVME